MKNKSQNMNNKRKRNNNKQSKFAIQQYEQNFISKHIIDSYKIQLAEMSQKEFISKATNFFFGDLIYKKYFEVGELFSLNKNSSYKDIQKINLLLNELKLNDYCSPRVIFFQSPPMIGMSYIIRYFNNNNFKFLLFNNSFGKDNNKHFRKYLNKEELFSEDYKDGSISSLYQKIFDIMRGNNNITRDNKTFFIIFKNLPYDLFLMALKQNNFTPDFLRNWEPTILQFFKEIKYLLDKNESNVKLIFFSDDKEIDEFELKTIFPKNIIDAPLTKNIIVNPITKRRMTDILYNFLNCLNPRIINENDIGSFIESIYLEFNSNIQKILDYLLLKITTEYYLNKGKSKNISQFIFIQKSQTHRRITTNNIEQKSGSVNKTKNKLNKITDRSNNNDFKMKKEKILDHDLFRLLGKLLYNKRYVPNQNSIQKLKKEEFGNNLETPRYYDIDELINNIPISNNTFNDLLMYNSIDHFNDIREYSDTFDLYSFTDTIDNFESYIYDKNNQYYHNNNYTKLYLNCLGVTTYNLSQYNDNKKFNFILSEKGLLNIRKPDIKINKNMNKFTDPIYYNACEYYPSLLLLNLRDFYKEGYNNIHKIKNMSANNNMNKNILKNKNYENIKSYYREQVNQKFLESNDKENINNNIGNNKDNDSPKTKKFRNIPEEDQKALESFFDGNNFCDESQTESDIEE